MPYTAVTVSNVISVSLDTQKEYLKSKCFSLSPLTFASEHSVNQQTLARPGLHTHTNLQWPEFFVAETAGDPVSWSIGPFSPCPEDTNCHLNFHTSNHSCHCWWLNVQCEFWAFWLPALTYRSRHVALSLSLSLSLTFSLHPLLPLFTALLSSLLFWKMNSIRLALLRSFLFPLTIWCTLHTRSQKVKRCRSLCTCVGTH